MGTELIELHRTFRQESGQAGVLVPTPNGLTLGIAIIFVLTSTASSAAATPATTTSHTSTKFPELARHEKAVSHPNP